MRAAPAVSLEAARSNSWRWTIGVMLALCMAVTATWAIQRGDLMGLMAASATVGYAAWMVWVERHPARWRLRWDGQSWWVACEGGGEVRCGDVAVALDLGAALLLRFEASDAGPRRASWLPLTRADSPAHWHALRCALYSPRPAPAAGVA